MNVVSSEVGARVQIGRVTRLHPSHGFGFIDAGRGEVFFDHFSVDGDAFSRIAVGSIVRFEERMGKRGPIAQAVTLVD